MNRGMKWLTALLAGFVLLSASSCTGKQGLPSDQTFLSAMSASHDDTGTYLLHTESRRLQYCDLNSMNDTVICNNPSCPHTPFSLEENPHPDCPAVTPNGEIIQCVFRDENHIYYLQSGGINDCALVQCRLDGSNKKTLASVAANFDVLCSPVLSDGKLLFFAKQADLGTADSAAFDEPEQYTYLLECYDFHTKTMQELARYADYAQFECRQLFVQNGVLYDQVYTSTAKFEDIYDFASGTYLDDPAQYDSRQLLAINLADGQTTVLSDDRDLYLKGLAGDCLYLERMNGEASSLVRLQNGSETVLHSQDTHYASAQIANRYFFFDDVDNACALDLQSGALYEIPFAGADWRLLTVCGDKAVLHQLNTMETVLAALPLADYLRGDYSHLLAMQNAEFTPVSSKPDEPQTEKFVTYEGKTELLYLNAVTYPQDTTAVQNALNRLLDARGYDFYVRFLDCPMFSDNMICMPMTDYLNDMERIPDLIFTGAECEDYQNNIFIRDTNHSFVEQGLLAPLDDFLQTDEGQKLYAAFDPRFWERMRCADGHIYGKSNNYTIATPLNLTWHPQEGFDKPEQVTSLTELEPILQAYRDQTGRIPLQIDSVSGVPLYYSLGFSCLRDAVYINERTGKPENILENPDAIAYFETMHRWRESGILPENPTMNWTYEPLCHFGQYNAVTGTSQDILLGQSYDMAQSISGATGIAKDSQHKEQAFRLLVLLNTDAEIADLLYNGIGADAGIAVYDTEPLTPVNPLIAAPNPHHMPPESAEKQQNCTESLTHLAPSVLYGKTIDLSAVEDRLPDIAAVYEKYWNLWLGGYDDVQGTCKQATEELNEAGLEEVLWEISRQLN